MAGWGGGCPVAGAAQSGEGAGQDAAVVVVDRERGLVLLDGGARLEEDGVRLGDGELRQWKWLLDGAGFGADDGRLRRMIAARGMPQWQVEAALRRQDWAGAAEWGNRLLAAVARDSEAEGLALLACFRGALADLETERAAVWWLQFVGHPHAAGIAREWGAWTGVGEPDLETGIAGIFPPVFCQRDRAASALDELERVERRDSAGWQAGAAVYGSALELAADRLEAATARLMEWTPADERLEGWRRVGLFSAGVAQDQLVVAPEEIARMAADRGGGDPGLAATAAWWLAVREYRGSVDRSPREALAGMLSLAERRIHDAPLVSLVALRVAARMAEREEWGEESAAVARMLELLEQRLRMVDGVGSLSKLGRSGVFR